MAVKNQQPISSTAQAGFDQSAVGFSQGAGKIAQRHHDTGQGTNLNNVKRALAKAIEHEKVCADPTIKLNLQNGIRMLQAQIMRATGQDSSMLERGTVGDTVTGYEFAGIVDLGDEHSTAIGVSGYDQSVISPFAAFQLAGSLRQKITKVAPHDDVTAGGSLRWQDPASRSNVIKTVDNPTGHTFPVGVPGVPSDMHVEFDARSNKKNSGSFQPGLTHRAQDKTGPVAGGLLTSDPIARGKHGQKKERHTWQQG